MLWQAMGQAHSARYIIGCAIQLKKRGLKIGVNNVCRGGKWAWQMLLPRCH